MNDIARQSICQCSHSCVACQQHGIERPVICSGNIQVVSLVDCVSLSATSYARGHIQQCKGVLWRSAVSQVGFNAA